VARRELDALRRHQVDERMVARRHRPVHRVDHAFVLLRAGDGEDVGKPPGDLLRLRAHAPRDDHFPGISERGADGIERLRLGAVEKAAGVDDHEVGAVVPPCKLITLRTQPRDDALGIDQRLGAAERDKADPPRRFGRP